MEKIKNKKFNFPVSFLGIGLIISFLLLFYIVGVMLQVFGTCDDYYASSPNDKIDFVQETSFVDYFSECELINDKCLDRSCEKYFLCNDQRYLVCEIYDCRTEFGIGTKDLDGKIKIRKKLKDESKKIMELKSRCNGSLEIIENNCIEERLEIKVKVNTAGSCRIDGFLAVYEVKEGETEEGLKSTKFSDLGEGIYSVKIRDCDEIKELIAIGESGISIK